MFDLPTFALWFGGLLPAVGLSTLSISMLGLDRHRDPPWLLLKLASLLSLVCACVGLLFLLAAAGLGVDAATAQMLPGFKFDLLAAWVALMVHLLACVIGAFSIRYLRGEALQNRHVAAYLGVIAGVQWMLIADHWLILIAAWSLVGRSLEPLLCFYPDRPFARLAAYKKRLADRLADVLLVAGAGIAWWAVGSGSLSALSLPDAGMRHPEWLPLSALAVALAVILRMACLPVHGWLIQVMEAPTPVSALLHAGVVNLGGFVLIRLAPLFELSPVARWLCVAFGLSTAVLAAIVMMTRISIKVRLAWSTVAQMGFVLLQCGLGLYTFAVLHLLGHSLYKAHAFLAASTVVREVRIRQMHGTSSVVGWSVFLAPLLTGLAIALTVVSGGGSDWPAWWGVVLAFAWSPLLWLSPRQPSIRHMLWQGAGGLTMLIVLLLAAVVTHALPFGLIDQPWHGAGVVAAIAFALLYLLTANLERAGLEHAGARRWAYAGLYLDEYFTRLALRIGSPRWMPGP